MTGREKIEAAFAAEGTSEIPVVLPYEGIYFRDHWNEVTSRPWWHQFDPDPQKRVRCFREAVQNTGGDWVRGIYMEASRERENTRIEVRADGVFRINSASKEIAQIHEPLTSGQDVYFGRLENERRRPTAETPEQIDELVAIAESHDPMSVKTDGRGDVALGLFSDLATTHYPIMYMQTPLWRCYDLWGFDKMMVKIATQPELVSYASRRYLELGIRLIREFAALGASAIWLEESFTDMISPTAFRALNVPLVSQLVDEIRSLGMKSILYFTGNPGGKWDDILSIGADALALEEGKKGFEIDIADVAEIVKGRCTLFGNLDSIGALERGSEDELKAEITRQVAAGRKNGDRFVMCLGSPATPGTPLSRVRQFCDLAHEIGRSRVWV